MTLISLQSTQPTTFNDVSQILIASFSSSQSQFHTKILKLKRKKSLTKFLKSDTRKFIVSTLEADPDAVKLHRDYDDVIRKNGTTMAYMQREREIISF